MNGGISSFVRLEQWAPLTLRRGASSGTTHTLQLTLSQVSHGGRKEIRTTDCVQENRGPAHVVGSH